MTASAAVAIAAGSTPGHSSAAAYVQSKANDSYKHYREPVSRGHARQSAMDALVSIYETSRQSGWDGHGATAISQGVYLNAYKLLEVIPEGISLPTVGAEPDGQISFEWHQSIHRTLSLSVTADGDIHYAALIGASRTYGTEPFIGQLPEIVLNLIQRVALG